MIRSTSLAMLLLFGVETSVHAQSHCTASEAEYFSCQIRHSSKVASLCGSQIDSIGSLSARGTAWLQYRFGLIGKPEFLFPHGKKASIEAFIPEIHKGVSQISFANGDFVYFVAQVNGEYRDFWGLSVVGPRGENLDFPCGKWSSRTKPEAFYSLVQAIAFPNE